MDTHFQLADPNAGSDRLGFALFLAITIHAIVIFGIGFASEQHPAAPPSLEVTLAQRPTEQKNDDASLLAQANQIGSGELLEHKEITTDKQSSYDDSVLRDTQPAPQPVPLKQQGKASQRSLITTRSDSRAIDDSQSKQVEQHSDQLDIPLIAPPDVLSSLHARLDRQKQAYNKIPKTLRLTSANTKAADHAAYLNYWIEKVERTGNLYYPERARLGKLYGDILMVVTLLPDGSVENIEIVSSSGHSALDQAAITTVRLAAPFAAFPQRMSEWNKMEITRTWRYMPGNRVVTSAN
ncbi:MAG: energy transducer TonB [Porticoccaceae bacterium]|nr:energy transducer TonB [Porticoccaceae bacterium]